MNIYLYVKTHTITGLKYLGKTNSKDPHKYPGSGTYWVRHLKKHGYNYTTDILKECTSKEEVAEFGLYYSELWNVVESNEWANLKPESGNGGSFKQTTESIAKMLTTRKSNNTLSTNSPESIAKGLATRSANGTLNTRTPASIEKMLNTRKANGNLAPVSTGESRAKAVATKLANGTNKRTLESIAKMLATKTANGTLNSSSPESIAKRNSTSKANGTNKQTPESIAKMLATRARNKSMSGPGLSRDVTPNTDVCAE